MLNEHQKSQVSHKENGQNGMHMSMCVWLLTDTKNQLSTYMPNATTDPVSSTVPMVGRQRFHQWLQWSCPIWTSPTDTSTTWYWKWPASGRSRRTTRRRTWRPRTTWRCSTPRNGCNWFWCRLNRNPTGHCRSRAGSCCRTHPNGFYLSWANKTYRNVYI